MKVPSPMHASLLPFRSHALRRTLAVLSLLVVSSAHGQSLISYEASAPLGLERAWFAQARVDNSQHSVSNWALFENNLLAVTDGGLVHSFDAETGETLWTAQPGPLHQPALGPGVSQNYVAVVSGATLYTLDRSNGRLLWSRTLGSAPAAAPALSETDAYVPFLSGRIESYTLDNPKAATWYYQSIGRIFYPPTVSGEVVSWPTNRGYLYVGQSKSPHVRYRIQTNSPASAPPTEADHKLFVAVEDGNVHCFELDNGRELWRYSMGFPGTGRPAVVGKRLYAESSEPMLHAVDATTGEKLWSIPGVTDFAAEGAKNVYGLDEVGHLVVFNKDTGQFVGKLPGGRYQAVHNERTDRIYLVDSQGLVQCLREIGAVQPTLYSQTPAEDEEPAAAASPFAEETPADLPAAEADEPSPFAPAESSAPDEDTDNPFGF